MLFWTLKNVIRKGTRLAGPRPFRVTFSADLSLTQEEVILHGHTAILIRQDNHSRDHLEKVAKINFYPKSVENEEAVIFFDKLSVSSV